MARFLSSIGIGSAEVDTVLPTDSVEPGQTLAATVEIDGGSDPQDVDEIYFAMVTNYQTEAGYSTSTLDEFTLADDFTIQPGEERSESVRIDVPYETPLTMGATDVWIETGLDIDWAVDPSDRDHIEVEPDERLRALLDAVELLGFEFHTAEVMSSSQGTFTSQSFVQELVFRPRSGPYSDELDEIELVPMPGPEAVEVIVEADLGAGLFEAMREWDDSKPSMAFSETDPGALASDLESLIEQHV